MPGLAEIETDRGDGVRLGVGCQNKESDMNSKREESEFEIIDQYGGRHRFKRSEGFWWAWRPQPGTADVPDPDFLDVFKYFEEDEDDEGEGTEVIATFPKPARVGNVCENSCLTLPIRELPVEQCPRCGFGRPGKPLP